VAPPKFLIGKVAPKLSRALACEIAFNDLLGPVNFGMDLIDAVYDIFFKKTKN